MSTLGGHAGHAGLLSFAFSWWRSAVAAWSSGTPWTVARTAVAHVAHHTGLPALVVAALLVAIGYRLLKRTARFALEVAAIAALLVVATKLGWIIW